MEMGLGKTASVLCALDDSHLPALVVAPPRVARYTWPTELDIWRPDLSYAMATGGEEDRRAALHAGADVTIVTKHAMPEAIPRRVKDTIWKTVILDESSMYKNSGSVGFRRAKTLTAPDKRKSPENVWLMTGTPSPNGLMDLYAQFKLLDGGKRLGQTLDEFRSKHFYPGKRLPSGTILEWILHDGMEEKIYKKVEDISIGMQAKYYLDLPPVTYNHIKVGLPPKARKVYNDMRKNLVIDMRDILGGNYEQYIMAPSAGVGHGKLSQIAAGFVFDDDRELHVLHKEKVDAMQSIVDEANGNPILAFYQFVWEKEELLKMGGVHIGSKEFTMERWNAGEIPLLIAHPRSASHGLNLQYGGHIQVWFSPTWELEAWEQGIARMARQGQTKPVIIHEILADGTVNEVAVLRLSDKAEVQQALKDHLESPV